LCPVASFGELVIDLRRPRPFGLKALSFVVAVNLVEFTDEGVELLLLLLKVGLVGQVLILFLLVR
jgi:hypothetical protein